MTTNAKKQNRILTAALIILIASLIALIALTSGANRRAKPPVEEAPPVARKSEQSAEAESAAPQKTPDKPSDKSVKKPAEEDVFAKSGEAEEKEPDQSLDERVTKGGAEADRDTAAVPTSAPVEELPVLRAPLENAVAVKGCSLAVPVFSATMNDYRVHSGIDFACAPGTPVLAAAAGTVSSVTKDPMMGWTVTLAHSGGAETRYAGLSEESTNIVKVGDKVLSGQVIGASGETALIESAEENHLHFELAVAGKTVDPAEYMDISMLADMYED